MGKDTAITDSAVQLMDPAGKQFQEMLRSAQTAAVDKLAVKPDATMVEEKGENKVSPTPKANEVITDADKLEPAEKGDAKDEPDDIPGDDIGNLKKQFSGLKAELARVRKQKSDSSDEVTSLRERLANTEGQLKVLSDGRTSSTLEAKLHQLADDQVSRNRSAWDDERTDARVAARLAARDADTDAVREANQRIADANKMLELYDTERDRRLEDKGNTRRSADQATTAISGELDSLFAGVYKAVPEMADKESDIWKAAKAEATSMPGLMKSLGALGELIATASAISKNPALVSKKTTEKLVGDIERAADKAFQKGGTAPSIGISQATNLNTREDVLSFEDRVRKIKGG